MMKKENNHVIRDIQRLISLVIERDPVDKNHEIYSLFDDLNIFE